MARRTPRKGEGSVSDSYNMRPSALHVDEKLNRRALLHPVHPELADALEKVTGEKPGKCTHSIANIEQRLASFKANGQLSPVTIYLTSTGDAFLVIGYLRWLAAMLAEVRGELDACGFRSKGKLACVSVGEPKKAADWLALADANIAENAETVPLTPIDIATNIQRYMLPAPAGQGMTLEEAAVRVGGYAERTGSWYLRLLKLSPTKTMQVHTGEVTPTKALKRETKTGGAGSPGPRAGVPAPQQRLALKHKDKRPPPTSTLNSAEMLAVYELTSGYTRPDHYVDEDGVDSMPAVVREWYTFLTPPEGLGKTSKKTSKKAPPRLEETT